MALALFKLFIVGLSTLTKCTSLVLFKGSAVLIVLLLRLLQLPACLVNCFLAVVRAGVVQVSMTVLAILGSGLASAMNGTASAYETIISSNNAAVETLVNVAKGKPEVLFNVTKELSEFAWDMAKNIVLNSTDYFMDAARFIIKYARA